MKLLKLIIKHSRSALFFAVVLISFAVIHNTVARNIVGFGDSDELLLAGAKFSLAHPPGYSLSTLFLHLIYSLNPRNYVFNANIFATLITAFTSGSLFLLINKVLNNKNKKLQILLALSSLMASFNFLIWQYANVWEVFVLHNFILIYLLLVIFSINNKTKLINYFGLGLLLSLGITHQQLFLLSLPVFVFNLWKKVDLKQVLVIILGSLTGIFSYIFLILKQATNSSFSWKLNGGIAGLIHFILRKDFAWGGYWLGFDVRQIIHSFNVNFIQGNLQYLNIIVLGISIFAMFKAYKILRKTYFYSFIYLWSVYAVLLVSYLSIGENQLQSLAINERMFVTGQWIWSIWFILGIYFVYLEYKKFWLIFIGLLALLTLNVLKNYPRVDLSNYKLTYNYAFQTLYSAPSSATIICFSDFSCFSLNYLQTVDNLREDVDIVPITPQLQDYIKQKNPQLLSYIYPDQYTTIAYVIAKTWQQNDYLILTELPDGFAKQLQLSRGLGIVPFGDNWIIGCSLDKLENFNFQQPKLADSNFLNYQKLHTQIMKKQRWQAKSLQDLKVTVPIATDACYQQEQLLKNSKECKKFNNISCEYHNLLIASLFDPENISIRVQLADLYKSKGLEKMFLKESQYISKLKNNSID